jgi:hypothetical protein
MVIVAGRSTRSLDRTGTVAIRTPIAIAAILLLSASQAEACSCIPSFAIVEVPATRARFIKDAKIIVHARVTKVLPDHTGQIEIIESFKGGRPVSLTPLSFPAMCGTTFTAGEERVYFVYDGEVNACGKYHPSPELLRALREGAK